MKYSEYLKLVKHVVAPPQAAETFDGIPRGMTRSICYANADVRAALSAEVQDNIHDSDTDARTAQCRVSSGTTNAWRTPSRP